MQTLRIRYILFLIILCNEYDCQLLKYGCAMICVQNLVELQELYNSQQLLTAELSVKLEKTEVRISVCSHFILLFWTFDLL
jgi:hypothetical protein